MSAELHRKRCVEVREVLLGLDVSEPLRTMALRVWSECEAEWSRSGGVLRQTPEVQQAEWADFDMERISVEAGGWRLDVERGEWGRGTELEATWFALVPGLPGGEYRWGADWYHEVHEETFHAIPGHLLLHPARLFIMADQHWNTAG